MIKINDGGLKVAGIYKIENLETHKVYIGETINLFNRVTQHLTGLVKGKHPNKEMQKDCLLYGIDSFKFEPLFILDKSLLEDKSYCYMINYLLYLESAFYKMYEQNFERFYNSIPYEMIKNKSININTYKINYDLLKQLLIDNPVDINYKSAFFSDYFIDTTINDFSVHELTYPLTAFQLMSKLPKQGSWCILELYFYVNKIDQYSVFGHDQDRIIYMLTKMGKIKLIEKGINFSGRNMIVELDNSVDKNYLYQDDSKHPKIDKGKIRYDRNIKFSKEAENDLCLYLQTDEIMNTLDDINNTANK